MGLIYKLTNRVDGTYYIGATTTTLAERKYMHRHHAREGKRQQPVSWALRTYGEDQFDWEIVCQVPDENLMDAEIACIAAARARGDRLYNITNGGHGTLGVSPSDETREKMRVAHTGKVMSAETRARMSAAAMGRTPWNKGMGKPKPPPKPKKSDTIQALADEAGISFTAMRKRLARSGGNPAGVRPTEVVDGKTFQEWADILGMTYFGVRARYRKFGNVYGRTEE